MANETRCYDCETALIRIANERPDKPAFCFACWRNRPEREIISILTRYYDRIQAEARS